MFRLMMMLTAVLISGGSIAMAEGKTQTLFDFTATNAAKQWQNVNDGVMGGVSEGEFTIADGKLRFTGTLSLENNGGFASVRSRPARLNLQKGDTLVAKVRGDGREYSMNLYVDTSRRAFAYRAPVPTKKGEWIEVKLPLDQFVATSFGRELREADPVKPGEVNAIGFLLSDKKAGPFQLDVESITIQRAQP